MKAIDELLGEATQNANELKKRIKRNASNEEKSEAVAEYIDTLEEGETNLNILIQLSEFYVRGEPHKILEFYHEVAIARTHNKEPKRDGFAAPWLGR